MRNIIVLFSLVIFISTSFAQKNDKALLVKYSKEELNTIKKESPKEYTYLKYCVKNAFYISEMPAEKVKANPSSFGEISIKNLDKINFYDLKIIIKEEAYQSFIITGTDKILIVKSKHHILRELNK